MRTSTQDSTPINNFWLISAATENVTAYYPSVLVECKLTFRSLRAGYHHTEERIYTAWYPENDLPIDWDKKVIDLATGTKFSPVAPTNLPQQKGNCVFNSSRFSELEDELISSLVRKEKLCLLYNPVFKLYSTPGQTKDDFLDKVSEVALEEMEPELKDLMRKFELKIEQVRESEERKGRKDPLPEPDLLKSLEKRSEIFTSKTRLTSMFLSTAKQTLKAKPRSSSVSMDFINNELQETLYRIEQEACDAANELYDTFLSKSQQCDTFEIGLQHQNIQVLRRGVLWLAY
ncbi:MAG: hypothetical protein HY819_11020 [Acidobacteria bacterium]|nr:hypothetical protein [Acidobacteriota bacterium]